MSKPYGVISDLHLHSWNAFSAVNSDGVNSRLSGLLSEALRCGKEVLNVGGNTLYIAGDLFHVRGSISPSVLNPTMDTFRVLKDMGITIRAIPGNHDLEGKLSTRLGSAITSLEGIGVHVCHDVTMFSDDMVLMLPWFESKEELKKTLEGVDFEKRPEITVIIHAPIDGVIHGLPNSGISAGWLGDLEFKCVLSGHYHNHKEFDHHVYSIGALAHHSWSDVGTKAGFLIVGDTGPRWMKSHLPEFIDITADTDPDDVPLLVEGNFVRAKIDSTKSSDVESIRAELMGMGAKGVVIQSIKKPTVERDGVVAASVSAGASLETSVASYIASNSFPDAAKVATECMNILAEAGC